MSLETYVLTYWWNPGSTDDRTGVAVTQGTSVPLAADAFGRALHANDHRVRPDNYELLSAVYVAPYGLEIAAVGLNRDGSRVRLAQHVSPVSRRGSEAEAIQGVHQYVVTGTEGGDDLRFAQILHADDLDDALRRVQDHLVWAGSDPDDVRYWSAVERYLDPELQVQRIRGEAPMSPIRVFWLRAALISDAASSAVLVEALGAPVEDDASAGEALEFVNRHRRRLGMSPLDPAVAGWSVDDVVFEAARIRRLANLGVMPC